MNSGINSNLSSNTMSQLTERQIYAEAIETFGIDGQIDMLHEEIGELQSAINKHKRGRVGREDVITEIADVMIMLGQMAYIYGSEEVRREKERKLERLQKRIKEHNDEAREKGGH